MDLEIDRDLVISLTRDLIRFPSVNPPGDELPAAQYLADRMRALGLEADVQVVEENRANVLGRLPGEGSGHLVLTGHIDVVPPGAQAWEHGPFDADMEGGRIYGRGSTDMKGGVAAIVTAMVALRRAGFKPKADLIAAITCGEEGGMLGAGAMADARSLEGARYLLVAEPTGLDVFIGEKGVFWVTIKAYGSTAHGSTPELGANAIAAIARIIPRLEEYPFSYTESALLGKPTLSVNVIAGGNKTNVVPDYCQIEVDMRTVPSQDHEQLLDQIRALVEETARAYDPKVRIEIEVVQSKASLETDPADPLVEAVADTARRVTGSEPSCRGVMFGTDAADLGPAFDIPMVICGPGGLDMLHQPNEYVEVSQLEQAARIFAEVAQLLLS